LKNFLKLITFAKPYAKHASLNILFNGLYVIFSLFSLSLLAPFLDVLFLKSNDEHLIYLNKGIGEFKLSISYLLEFFNYKLSYLIINYGKYFALCFVSFTILITIFFKNLFRYLAMYNLSPVRNYIVRDIRNKMFVKTLFLPISFFTEEKKGDLISRITNDVQEIEWSVMQSLEALFREPLNILVFVVTLFWISPELTLFVFMLLPITGYVINRIGKSLRKTSGKSKELLGEILSVTEEALNGQRVIKSFNAQSYIESKFNALNQEFTKLMIKVYRKTDLTGPTSEVFGVFVLVCVMLYGGNLVLGESGSLKASSFITYIALFSQLIPPVKALSTALNNAQKGVASAERIYKILDAEESVSNIENALIFNGFKDKIEIKNLSFTYSNPNELVLKNINLTIPRGKITALVGQSGSGKSTLADLLSRFYDPTEGDIYIDENNLRDINIYDYRKYLGVVAQESVLFNDSISANISFGLQNVGLNDIIHAAKIANAHDFILQTPDGYNSIIGDKGSKLSGGQRQRLSIARAVLRNPELLILDEATSALDSESEKLVQDALVNLMKGRTSIVIAHRLSTIMNADNIVVLHEGEIVESGTHEELLKLNGYYSRLFNMQAFI
jgi:subfamily B ATP-binding cassette protein MsbA